MKIDELNLSTRACNTLLRAGINTVEKLKSFSDNELKHVLKSPTVLKEIEQATDRGGYYCMPLYTNIQHGKPGWRITQCPECGAKCWRIPLAEISEEQGARGLCTMCALKKGVGA